MTDGTPAPPDPEATLQSRRFLGLLVLAAIVGVVVSFAAWCFLELVHQIQQEAFTHLPHAVGYHNGPPLWWYLPWLALAGLIVAVAVVLLPGRGGHVPAHGLMAGGGTPDPSNLPGIVLAALATVGLGVVLGPEAPLIALGGGLAVLAVKATRRDVPQQGLAVVAAAGSFAALSMIFDSPLIAAVILIEAAGIGGKRLPLIILPGLLAAGIGSLISTGMGAWTGLSTSAYTLGALPLHAFARPTFGNFGWTILLGLAVAVAAFAVLQGGLACERLVAHREFLLLPLAGLAIAGLAIAFTKSSGEGINYALFSGQDALSPLVQHAATFSLGALALLIVFKGLAWSVSLGGFRGGPTFPAIFLGAAGGIMFSHLPGFAVTPAVAVGIGAGVAAVLRLPLSAVVLATLLTSKSGAGAEPLIIVGVIVTYLATLALARLRPARSPAAEASPGERARDAAPTAAAAHAGAEPRLTGAVTRR